MPMMRTETGCRWSSGTGMRSIRPNSSSAAGPCNRCRSFVVRPSTVLSGPSSPSQSNAATDAAVRWSSVPPLTTAARSGEASTATACRARPIDAVSSPSGIRST